MKKLSLLILLVALPLMVSAQTLKFGYFRYNEVLKSMKEYAIAQQEMAALRAKYDAETKRSENDFHAKYEDFLEGQRNFAPSILKKRQAELQEMIDKNVAFKKETQRLLEQAEKEAFAPAHRRLQTELEQMGRESGYAFILNADNNTLPYVNNAVGEDITEALKTVLK
ncbi:OmpH family outer membrane protein [Prevotella ihumii]|uniref:OmpH family outer membrane protein n=1 Tax=Prevotella ihumii TaxID=1917878 RepID=UPI00098168E3|nr:OmpH family outer membrane protein [Prevotella ihumii]